MWLVQQHHIAALNDSSQVPSKSIMAQPSPAATYKASCHKHAPEGRVSTEEKVAQYDAKRPNVCFNSIIRVGGVEGRLKDLQVSCVDEISCQQENPAWELQQQLQSKAIRVCQHGQFVVVAQEH
jgi:hypothetical protein